MIRIVTDSGVNLPSDLVGHPDLTVVPLLVVTPGRSYKDGVDLTTPQLLDLMRTLPQIPTTSQPSAGDFVATFEKALSGGNEVLAILLSSKLSGTVASAEAARQALADKPITVFDSLSVSMGQGIMVAEALRSVQQGWPVPQIVDRLEFVRDNMRIGFVVDSLEHLQKGGRIGKASVFLGTLLSVKPMLSIREGEVSPLDKVRTRRRAVERLVEWLAGEVGTERDVHIGVVHLNAPEDAEALRQRCAQTFRSTTVFISELGAVLGVHVGPGTVGVCVCPVCPS